MFSFAGKLLAFVLIAQFCTSEQSEQSSFLRCLTGYKDKYENQRYFGLLVINSFFLATVNYLIVPQIESFPNVLVSALKPAKIPM
jgi:hypothetical protein